MRKIFFVSICIFFAFSAHCQNIGTMSELLKKLEVSDSISNAKVVVVNNIAIDLAKPLGDVEGYRIRLVFDNSQNARDSVENEKLRYLELYPNDSTYVEYQSPYFKLTAGNFLSHEEALMYLNKVVKEFKNAFIVKENIRVSQFMSDKRRYELGEIPLDTLLMQQSGVIDSLMIIDTIDIVTDIILDSEQ